MLDDIMSQRFSNINTTTMACGNHPVSQIGCQPVAAGAPASCDASRQPAVPRRLAPNDVQAAQADTPHNQPIRQGCAG